MTSLAAWQGKPFVLWFIGAGCSSCAISVPTMVKHLPTFAASGVHVIAVDLYGDLPPGDQGLRYLRQFGHDTAGARFTDPAWTWGLASRQLSYRYDPTGTPDLYFAIDQIHRRVTYRGGAPVSAIGNLLDHVNLVAEPVAAERPARPAAKAAEPLRGADEVHPGDLLGVVAPVAVRAAVGGSDEALAS